MICVFCLQGKRGDRGSAGRDGPPVRKWWNFVWSTFNFFYCTVHFVLRDSCLTIEKEPSFFWLLIFVKSESDFEHWLCFCRVSCSNLLAPVAEFGSEFWNQSAVFFWCRFVELICKFVVLWQGFIVSNWLIKSVSKCLRDAEANFTALCTKCFL